MDYDPLEEAYVKGQLMKTLSKIKGVTRKQMEMLNHESDSSSNYYQSIVTCNG